MADKKISEFPSGVPSNQAVMLQYELASERGGANYKLTLQDVMNLIGPNASTSPFSPYTFPQFSATTATISSLNVSGTTTLANITTLVHTHIFKDIKERYQFTPVYRILYELQEIIYYTIRTAMNLPYPRNPHFYIDRLSDNVFDIYMDNTYAKLRTEMIMVHHSASVIQRTWKKLKK